KLLHSAELRDSLASAPNAAAAFRLLADQKKNLGSRPDAKTVDNGFSQSPQLNSPVLPHKQIEKKLQQAVRAVLPDADVSAVLIRPSSDPKFGDYQSNALMSLAKTRKINPRQLATDVVAKLDVAEWCEPVEIAGAGFLNFRLKPAALAKTLESAARGEHLFFEKATHPRTVVIDFSSPNVAKPMHVGHIRSTGIGDALQRIFRLIGHRVISDNHIGDWGTQFGKLLLGWKQILGRPALE